jgi:hypothetical protein
MFKANRRVKLPKEIKVSDKIVNNKQSIIKVEVVETFKLLGVILNNKINFIEHCSTLKKLINRKLHNTL